MKEDIESRFQILFETSPSVSKFKKNIKNSVIPMFEINLNEDLLVKVAYYNHNKSYMYRILFPVYESINKFFPIKYYFQFRYIENCRVNFSYLQRHTNYLYHVDNEYLTCDFEFTPYNEEDMEILISKLMLFNEDIYKSVHLIKILEEKLKKSKPHHPLTLVYIFSKGFCVCNSLIIDPGPFVLSIDLELYLYRNKILTVEEVISLSEKDYLDFISFSKEIENFKKTNPDETLLKNKYPIIKRQYRF